MFYEDPLIDEIYAIRRKIFLEECQDDSQKLLEYYQRIQAELSQQVVEFEPAISSSKESRTVDTSNGQN
jgi:hypothetical protein